jgi:hypothetical protein
MRRYAGELLMGTGALHTLIGVVGFRRTLGAIHRARYVNAIGRDPERAAALWCLTTGGLLVVLGQLARSVQARTGAVPRSLGWGLLALAVPGVVLLPASGFWLVLGQALLVLRGAQTTQDGPGAPAGASPDDASPAPSAGLWARLRRVFGSGG